MNLDAYSISHDMKAPPIHVAASLFQRICYEYKDQLLAGIICAGWDEEKGGQVYALTLGGTTVRQKYTIGGSGSTYIYGFCDKNYKPNMTKEECVKFVRLALAHAMARDGSSGGVIRTVTITKDGVDRTFTPGDQLPYHAEQDAI